MQRNSPPSPTRTPEGRSIVVLTKEKYEIRGRDLVEMRANFIPFTAQEVRMSGVVVGSSWVRKGAVDAVINYLNTQTAAVTSTGQSGRFTRP